MENWSRERDYEWIGWKLIKANDLTKATIVVLKSMSYSAKIPLKQFI